MAPEPRSRMKCKHGSELNLWTLFDSEEQGKITSLAQLATIHYQQHRRPLRIVLDQDSWDYGVTRQEEREIQKSQRRAFNKRKRKEQQRIWCKKYNTSQRLKLFHREVDALVRLMSYIALGIEFYVIVPSPLSREEVGEFGDRYKHANGRMHIWFRILGDLGIRFHAATNPIVECAHMQAAGVVDAIWTNDPDIMVYSGRDAIIYRDYVNKVNGVPSSGNVQVYRMEEINLRSGCSIPDELGVLQGDHNFIKSTSTGREMRFCKCQKQEDINHRLQNDMNKPKYRILENCLIYSAANENLDSRESKLFRQKIDTRMHEIEKTREDALTFYNANMVDRTRRLWEYSRDTFSMKPVQFLSLMAGVLFARSSRPPSNGPDAILTCKETDYGENSYTAQVPLKVEDMPPLWNLRLKMTEDIAGMVLNPTILKSLAINLSTVPSTS